MQRLAVLAVALVAWPCVLAAQPAGPAPSSPTAPAPATPAPAAPAAPADQSAPPAAAPAQSPTTTSQAGDTLRLPADTVVRIAITQALNSQSGTRGQTFPIQLASPIVVDGRIVAPAGSTGGGEIVYAEPGGGGGAPGKLVLAARYIDVGSVRIPLKAFHLAAGGKDEFTEMDVAAALIGPAVMFMNGQNVVYPVGTRANAKVAQDVDLPAGPPAPEAPAAAPSAPATATAATPAAAPSAPAAPASPTGATTPAAQ